MNLHIKSQLLIAILTVFFCSCEELTETDLTNATVNIIGPIDSLQTSMSQNTFIWDKVNGAVRYQFQIASPKFDSVVTFVIDSSLQKNLILYTLTPGRYQWRVRATNKSTNSAYFVRTIIIQ